MNTKRFDALTGMRALAASMVFVYHNRKYWRSNLHPEILRIINEFHIGVSLFFVLSGFLLAFTYGEKPLQSKGEYRKYLLVRMARIFPLYWLILTAYYIDPRFGNYDFSILTYTLTHGFSNVLNLKGIAQAWSLSVEFTFYLLLPFLCFLENKRLIYLVVALFLCSGIFWLSGELWYQINGNPLQFFRPIKFLLGSTFAGRWSEFLAGIILARALKGKTDWMLFWDFKCKTWVGFLGIIGTAYLIGLFQHDIFHHGTDHPIGYLLHMLLLPIFIIFALAGLIDEKTVLSKFFSSKFLVLLGNASFAFYLIHISYVNVRLRWLWIGPDRNFIVLWAFSIILYWFFEKPIYDFVRKKIGRSIP